MTIEIRGKTQGQNCLNDQFEDKGNNTTETTIGKIYGPTILVVAVSDQDNVLY